MGRYGSLTPSSSVGTSVKDNNRITPINGEQASDEDLYQLAHINDSFTTRTSLNPTTYSTEMGMLNAYPEGSQVTVTYFYQNLSEIDIKSAVIDIPDSESILHTDLTEIRNFVIRQLSPFENDYDGEHDNSNTLTFDALFYPGIIPHIGDLIVYGIGDSNYVIFSIKDITPTTYRQGTYHKVTFLSQYYLTDETYSWIKKRVKDIQYFDLRKYLDDGELTFLDSQSYINLKDLEKLRVTLIEFYMNKFYSKTYESVISQDRVYDPYLVQYLKKKIAIKDYKYRPEQLLTSFSDYHRSIWYKLSGSVNMDNWDDIISTYYIKYNKAQALSPTINGLSNEEYVVLGKDKYNENKSYVFSQNFYQKNIDEMDITESLVYQYLNGVVLQPQAILDASMQYRKLGIEKQYYYIPVYLELIDTTIRTMR